MLPLPAAGAEATGDTTMSSTQHQLIEQCATRLRGIVEALDNIHDNTPHRWSTELDDVHSSAESLLALITTQAAQDLALRTIAKYPCPEQNNMTAANMRQVAADAITGALAFGAQASQPPAEDHWLRPFYDIGRAEGQRTQELAMLVRMLASSLKRYAPESNLVARATNYLAAKGLAGTPLRDPPAPVEQAGGDERVIGWRERILAAHPNSDPGFWPDALLVEHMAAEIADLRAALAQPSPVRSSLLINGYQLRAALDFIAPDGTAEQLESEACIEWRQQDADFLEAGLYAFCAEYPEEGSVLLDEEPTNSQPSPAQEVAERGTQHRFSTTEQTCRHDFAGVWWNDNGETKTGKECRECGFFIADIAEAPELERPEVVGYRIMRAQADKIYQRVDKAAAEYEAGRSALGYMEDIAEAALWLRNRLDDLLAAAPAQAQHSVPDHAELLQALERTHAGHMVGHDQSDQPKGGYSDGYVNGFGECIKVARKVLAAAPGKEVPQAWLDVQAERRRQITAEGWTPEHDDEHADGQMAQAAGCYALHAGGIGTDWPDGRQNGAALFWPWDKDSWKPTTPRRDLVKACALALAEIERLDRAGISQSPQPGATTASS